MNKKIQDKLAVLTSNPGVYIMKNAADDIIYVGKAKNLKNRVSQYFVSNTQHTPKVLKMVSNVDHFEYIVTGSELEALILENNLIKQHRPKYNILLKDDKTYPYIALSKNTDFPRFTLSRRRTDPGYRYFGPFQSSKSVWEIIRTVNSVFGLYSCKHVFPRDFNKFRPCLNYHIKQCDAPCQGYISREEYGKAVNEVLRFLNGNYDSVLKELEDKMNAASEELEFERAIEYRELISSVKKVAQKQKITDSSGEDRDVLAVASEEEDAVVQVFFIRGGRLIGRDHFYLRISKGENASEILNSFILQYYAGTPFIPGELMLQEEVEDRELLETWLTSKRGQKVILKVPRKGTKEKLVELAQENARLVLSKDKERLKREEGRTIGAV